MRRKYSLQELKKSKTENLTFQNYISRVQTANTYAISPRNIITAPTISTPSASKDLTRSKTEVFASVKNSKHEGDKNEAFLHTSKMLTTVRSVDLRSPKDPMFKFSIQHDSNLRLFRGSRGDLAINPTLSTFQPTENIEKLEQEAEEKENFEFDKFIDGLKFMEKLKSELTMNFQMARIKEYRKGPNNPSLGLYYTIEKEFNDMANLKPSELIQFTRAEIVKKFHKYSCIMRDIIRSVRNKDGHDEAVVLELF